MQVKRVDLIGFVEDRPFFQRAAARDDRRRCIHAERAPVDVEPVRVLAETNRAGAIAAPGASATERAGGGVASEGSVDAALDASSTPCSVG